MTPTVMAMTDAAYVYGGWLLTGGVFALYTARLIQKTRRAAKMVARVEQREP